MEAHRQSSAAVNTKLWLLESLVPQESFRDLAP